MLEPDLAAGVEERLVVLVVVVQGVLAPEQQLDEVGVGEGDGPLGFLGLERGDVVEAAEAAGDVARRQRLAFERR